MNKRELETKLKDITNLRLEYYFGVSEAKKYLHEVSLIDEKPVKLSESINNRLENTTYAATPIRLAGILNVAGDYIHVPPETDEVLNEFYDEVFWDYMKKSGMHLLLTESSDLLFVNSDESKSFDETMTDIFIEINKHKIKTDPDAIEIILYKCKNHIDKFEVNEDDRYLLEEYNEMLYTNSRRTHENTRFTKKILDGYAKSHYRDIEHFTFSVHKMYERLKNDGLLAVIKYQRQILIASIKDDNPNCDFEGLARSIYSSLKFILELNESAERVQEGATFEPLIKDLNEEFGSGEIVEYLAKCFMNNKKWLKTMLN